MGGNPSGGLPFDAWPRCSSLVYIQYTTLLAPCPASKGKPRRGLGLIRGSLIEAMTPLFRLYLWPDRLLLLGPGFDTGFHRHHAAQLCLGLEGPLKLRHGIDQPWSSAPGFFVAPDQPHQFDAGAGA